MSSTVYYISGLYSTHHITLSCYVFSYVSINIVQSYLLITGFLQTRLTHSCINMFMVLCITALCCDELVLWRSHSQTVDHRSSISSIILLLPLGQSSDQLQNGAFGQRRVSVRWPTNILEMLDQPVAILRLEAKQDTFWEHTVFPENIYVNSCFTKWKFWTYSIRLTPNSQENPHKEIFLKLQLN